jgi:flagellar motor switch/type III secretory pathway protein FliN
MDLTTLTTQAPASVALPPATGALPDGAKPVQWEEFDSAPAVTQAGGLDVRRHETLHLQIELGRTHIHWGEAEKLRTGSVIPLDNAAGDLVDLYAGGQLIGRGEVLDLHGTLGVRVVQLAAGKRI